MRTFLLAAVAAVLALPAAAQTPAPGDAVVNEIQYDPPAPQASTNEWVEIANRSAAPIDLQGLVLSDGTNASDPIAASVPLAPGGLITLVRNETEFTAAYPGVPFVVVSGFPALNNSGDTPQLLDGATVIDAVPYLPSWGGADASLERIDVDGPSDQASNFATTTDPSGGTPGAENTATSGGGDTTPPDLVSASAPAATTVVAVFSEVLDPGSAETASNYSIDGGVGTPASAVLDGDTVTLTLGAPLATGTYTLTVSGIADLAGNVLASDAEGFAFTAQGDTPVARDVVLNEFLYDPPAAQDAGEYVELFNRSAKTFDLSRFRLNDATGDPTVVTDEPTTLAPGEYAVVVQDGARFAAVFPGVAFIEQPSWSALNNTGDDIRLTFEDGTLVDALSYTPGAWGGSDVAVERRDPDGPSNTPANWGEADGVLGTPGAINTQFGQDTDGPLLTGASANAAGTEVVATVDEPLDPASVSAAAFAVSGTTVTAADYDGDTTVTLTLGAPLTTGTITVTATDLSDLVGNVTPSSSVQFAFEADETPPGIASVEAVEASTVVVAFTEPVTVASAEPASAYAVDGAAPASVTLELEDGAAVGATLALGAPLAPGPHTLAVTGLRDLVGNVGDDAAAFFFGEGDVPEPQDLVINEFLYDPPSAQPAGEYVELFNRSDKTFDLRDFALRDASDTPDPVTNDPVFVSPGEYVVVVQDPVAFAAVFPGVPFVEQPSWNALNNTGDQIRLSYQGVRIDSLAYEPGAWGGSDVAVERRDPDGPSATPANWAEADGVLGTPGAINSQFGPDVTGPVLVAASADGPGTTVVATVDEPLDPASVSAAAFAVSGTTVTAADYDGDTTVTLTLGAPLTTGTITVTASGLADLLGNVTPSSSVAFEFEGDETPPGIASAEALSASAVQLGFTEPVTAESASAVGTYVVAGAAPAEVLVDFGDGGAIGAVLTLAAPLPEAGSYTVTATGLRDLAGNEGNDTATFFFGQGDVPEPQDLVINEFLYDPPAAQPSGEYVELFNRSDKTFDLRDFALQDESDTPDRVTDAAVFVGPGEYAVVVQDGEAFAAVFPGVPFVEQPSWNTLNNSDDQIRLTFDGVLVDSLLYVASVWGGTDVALERRDPEGPSSSPANWAEASGVLGTPGALNTQFGPDVTGPTLVDAEIDRAGRVVTVETDEPLDPASLAGAFAVSGTTVTDVSYAEGTQTVTLTLGEPLATGTVTVTATDLRDVLGNVTPTSTVQVEFVRDEAPPGLASAAALTETTVAVRFTEPVTPESAGSVGTYAVEGRGMPAEVAVETGGGGAVGATLTFEQAFELRTIYVLTVTGLVDLAGNVQTEPATATLFLGEADRPAPGELVINEIQYDPLVGSAGEYVELVNTTTERVFDLGALGLDDGDADDDPVTDGPTPVPPGTTVAVVRDADAFSEAFPGAPFVLADAFQSLSNSGAPLVLRDLASGAAVDSVAYDPDWHRVELDDATGVSLERRDPAGPSNAASNWSSSLDERGGTPGAVNTVSVLAGETPAGTGLEITSPFAPDEGESARIAYALSTEAALVRVRIFDGGGRLVRELEAGRFGGASGSVSWDGRDDRGERLRIGLYIVLLDAVDAQGGTSESFRDVVVLARR